MSEEYRCGFCNTTDKDEHEHGCPLPDGSNANNVAEAGPTKECEVCHQHLPAWTMYNNRCGGCQQATTMAANTFWPEMELWLTNEAPDVDKRTRGRLRNFFTYVLIGDIDALCAKSARDLRKYRNIGRACVGAIEAWLGSKGRQLVTQSGQVWRLERELEQTRERVRELETEAHKVKAEDTPA